MFRDNILILLLALIISTPVYATDLGPLQLLGAGSPRVVATGSCPQGSGLGDGCPGLGGNFQQAGFYSYAAQSGQTWTSAHPWAFNSPGIDYPVGYYTTTGSLKDPTNNANLPSGCSFTAGAGGIGSYGGQVRCDGVNSLTISGFDFSLHNCVTLYISNTNTGTVTISNNKFVNGSGCSVVDAIIVGNVSNGSGSAGTILNVTSVVSGIVKNGDLVQGAYNSGSAINNGGGITSFGTGSGGTGTYNTNVNSVLETGLTYNIGRATCALIETSNGFTGNVIFTNNYVDGNAVNNPISMCIGLIGLYTSGSGDVTIEYNAILRAPGRPFLVNGPPNLVMKYNYIEDWVYVQTDSHGDIIVNSPSSGETLPLQQYSYNVGLLGSNTLYHGSTTLFWLDGSNFTNNIYTSSILDHNIAISNCWSGSCIGGNNYTVAGALTEAQDGTYTNININNNWIDNSGAIYNLGYIGDVTHTVCTNVTTFSGNILLTTGANVNAWSSGGGGC